MRKQFISLFLIFALFYAITPASSAVCDTQKIGQPSIVSAGNDHSAVIDKNGSLWMWGEDSDGQLGYDPGDTDWDGTTPLKVMDNVASVSLGQDFSAAVKTDGSLWVWGDTSGGQLGNGTDSGQAYTPVKVMTNVAAVSAGEGLISALKTDGSLWAWGQGVTTPTWVMGDVISFSSFDDSVSAVTSDGSVWWIEIGQSAPEKPIKATNIEDVAAVLGPVAIKTDGSLWAYAGYSAADTEHIPVKLMDNVAAITAGNSGYAVLKNDGSLWTAGENKLGQLGNGTTTSSYLEIDVTNFSQAFTKVMDNVTAVSAGGDHVLAIKTDGSVWIWGSNASGQLGNGGTGNQTATESISTTDGFRSYTFPIQTIPLRLTGLTAPFGVRLMIDGGSGVTMLWTATGDSLIPPTNPTRDGYSFAGWYTDSACTIPWDFDNGANPGLTLYAKWQILSSTAEKSEKSAFTITLDGEAIALDAYVLKADSNGGDVTFVKLRDIAMLLNGTKAQCNVDWVNGTIRVILHAPYTTQNGAELKPIDGADGSYKLNTSPILFDGYTVPLEGIVITDKNGGGNTFFKLRDLAKVIGFNVGWSAERGIYIETDKPYSE